MMAAYALLLAATASPPVETIPEYGAGTCKANSLKLIIGRSATKQRVDWARKKSTANEVRKFRDSDAVTQDYRTGRLNIVTDRRNIIRKVYCG